MKDSWMDEIHSIQKPNQTKAKLNNIPIFTYIVAFIFIIRSWDLRSI